MSIHDIVQLVTALAAFGAAGLSYLNRQKLKTVHKAVTRAGATVPPRESSEP